MKDTFIDAKHYEESFVKNEFIPEEAKNIVINNNIQNLKNNIRFTKKQVEGIYSGVHKGLTLIVGPPGTGKTDVAVQIISLIYQNFPSSSCNCHNILCESL